MRTNVDVTLAVAALLAGCSGADLDARYRSEQMPEFAAIGERMVTDYLTRLGITDDSLPTLTVVPFGRTVGSKCVDINGNETQNDRSNDYCPTDNAVYVGQSIMWDSYRQFGSAGPLSGLAHEYGHFLQSVMGVPNPLSATETIRHENQADCFSGTFIAFLHDRANTGSPNDLGSVEHYLTATASADAPGRDHGTARERIDSFALGYDGGLPACTRFFPSTPLIR
jgi:predicted metalloprotease